jgi:hypothetical protein
MPNIHTFTDLDEIFGTYCRGQEIIDIGGMSGDINDVFPTEKLKRFAKSLTCVDANTNAKIDLTGIEFIQARIQDFNSPRKFHVAFCGEVIEHIADQESFLRKIKSLLTEDGMVIVTTPNSSSLSDFVRTIWAGRDPRQDLIFEPVNSVYVSGHVVIHNIGTLQQLFHGIGFDITDVYYRRPIGGSFLKQALRDAILKWRPHLSSQIVVVARLASRN